VKLEGDRTQQEEPSKIVIEDNSKTTNPVLAKILQETKTI
jgi:hypothetical protein